MLHRIHPALLFFGGSGAILVILILLLAWPGLVSQERKETLIVHCAAAMRVPMEAIAADYEREQGRKVELRIGASQAILTNIEVTGQGDIFLPADDSYIEPARKVNLVSEVLPLARMSAVVVVPAGNPKKIQTWNDLLKVRIAQAEPDAAAIGKLTRDHLRKIRHWDELNERTLVYKPNVTDVANSVALETVDAGIVWDAVALPMSKLIIVCLPELSGIEARVQIAVLKTSANPEAALQFARYVITEDKGLRHFRAQGFQTGK